MGEYAEHKAMGSKMTRTQYINCQRRLQPLDELRRKASKAKNRANLYTQEELDLAAAEACELVASLRVE